MSNRTSSSAHQQEKVRRRNWRKFQNKGSSTLLHNGLLKASQNVQNGWMSKNKEFCSGQKISQIDIPTTSSSVDTINKKKKYCMGNSLNSTSSSTRAEQFEGPSYEDSYLSNDEDILDNKCAPSPKSPLRKMLDMSNVQPKKLNGIHSSKTMSRSRNGRFQSSQKQANLLKTKEDSFEEDTDSRGVGARPVKHEDEKQLDSWIRRKFYIVENGGRPAEVYCTDFVHKAKHGDSKFRPADESRLMKIVDRWREEWNRGVQMPLCAQDKRESYIYEKVCLFPFSKENENVFELPRKYVALNEKRYVNLSPNNFEVRECQPLYLYEINYEDEEWIHKQNLILKSGHHTQVKKKIFLDVINALEIDCYRKIHLALLEPLIASVRNTENTDDDAECDICRMPEWEPGDEIVFCDGCNICVHQSCYGLDSVPTEEWLCTNCSLHDDCMPQPCIFCPIRGGAMKYTKTFESWSHVICALWLPEVRFGDVERREPITCVSEVPAERWQSKCSVCDTREGACINCTAPGCNIPFHVSCAQRGGLVLRIEHSAEKNSGVAMISLCRRHSASSSYGDHHGEKRASTNSPQKKQANLEEMLLNFSEFVDCQNISQRLDIPLSMITQIFRYWQTKRKENKWQPLISEPLDRAIYLSPPHPVIPSTAQRKQSHARIVAPLSEKVLREYDYIRTLRQNLEKTGLGQVTTQIAAKTISYDLRVPLSQRRTDKLLELWDVATRGGALPEGGASQQEKLNISKSSHSAASNQVSHVAYLSPSMGLNRRKNTLAAAAVTDVFEFRSSNSPAREEDSISNSDISTLTEYSLAISGSDSNTLYEFDLENAANIEEAGKKKKKKKKLLSHKSYVRSGSRVMTPINYCKEVKKQRLVLPQLDESQAWSGGNSPKRMCLRNKIF